MVVELDLNFWWEDSSCLAPEVHHNTVAVICQCDIDVASTTTASESPTTTRIPEPTTVTTPTTEVTTTTAATTTLTPGNSCPSGWQKFEGHCYLLVEKFATWANAENDCISKGGHLASIHSADENNFIFQLQPSPHPSLWIGGSDTAVEVILHTSGFWLRVRAPVFLGSLSHPTGHCAPPPHPSQLRCSPKNKKNDYFQKQNTFLQAWAIAASLLP